MEKLYKQTLFNLTRNNPLPSNCLPFTANKNTSESLKKLLEINQSIMDLLDPSVDKLPQRKRKSQARLINFENNGETERNIRRIHPNVSYYAANIHPKTERRTLDPHNIAQHRQKSQSFDQTSRRKDIYDDQIEKYINNQADKDQVIQKYLTNREKFVKQACKDIENEIKHGSNIVERSIGKKRSKIEMRKLPRIQEFTSYMLKKDKRKAEDGPYLQQINHLKKVQFLDHKHRQRQQRVFRKKIHSLEYRLDKIRQDSQE